MGYELRMSAEIHDWLTNLRSEDPPAAALVADALTTLTTEGAALGPPLVVPVAIGASDLSDALDQAYQDDLAAAQIMRRRTADAAALAHDIRSQMTELESLRDQLSEQRQRALDEDMPEAAAQATDRLAAADDLVAGLRERLPGVIEAERQLTDTSRVMHERTAAFRTRKEVLKASYVAAQAERQWEEEFPSGDEEGGDAAARLAEVTEQIERELRRHLNGVGLIELRPAALCHGTTGVPDQGALDVPGHGALDVSGHGALDVPGHGTTSPRGDSGTQAPADSRTDVPADGRTDVPADGRTDPPDGGIRILFAVEPPSTALLISVLEDDAAVSDYYREAVLLSAGVLRRVRAGQAPEAAEFGYDDASV
jgi:phage shock protein A